MAKKITLTENELIALIEKVVKEQVQGEDPVLKCINETMRNANLGEISEFPKPCITALVAIQKGDQSPLELMQLGAQCMSEMDCDDWKKVQDKGAEVMECIKIHGTIAY